MDFWNIPTVVIGMLRINLHSLTVSFPVPYRVSVISV